LVVHIEEHGMSKQMVAQQRIRLEVTLAETKAETVLHRAYDQMGSALQALDAIGERTASAHLDHAIVCLGLRPPECHDVLTLDLLQSIATLPPECQNTREH
jgi:hypothetical protein